MFSPIVRDLCLTFDTAYEDSQNQYNIKLYEGQSEEGDLLSEQTQTKPFLEMAIEAMYDPSEVNCGAMLFDWVFPLESRLRMVFLDRCEKIGQDGDLLRLWICSSISLAESWEFKELERRAIISWEGFWIREWADIAKQPRSVQSPFLVLNHWIHILRCQSGVSVRRRFTVQGKLNVLIIISNPPPGEYKKWRHLEHLEQEDGSGIYLRVFRPFNQNRNIGWVFSLRNPTKVGIARCIQEYRPHVVIYLGHGYSTDRDSGLVLAVNEEGRDFEQVSGTRKCPELESELEKVLAGKWQALENPDAHEGGLTPEDRPRLFVAFACEAASAAPALLRCGVPAVLAMRRQIPDSDETEAMVKHFAEVMSDKDKSVEEEIASLRQFLKGMETRFRDERLHFSVPILHLAVTDVG
jgi:hypothetical protein